MACARAAEGEGQASVGASCAPQGGLIGHRHHHRD
jgi:hypothetical protein